jgi:hypothetical protein
MLLSSKSTRAGIANSAIASLQERNILGRDSHQ